jgi:hypothetical protein
MAAGSNPLSHPGERNLNIGHPEEDQVEGVTLGQKLPDPET